MTVLIYIKRALKHIGILLMLLTVPISAYIYKSISEKSGGTAAGIYDSGNSDDVLKYLDNSAGIDFIVYDDPEKMKNDVKTKKIECGFIIPENIDDVLSGKEDIIFGEGETAVLSEVTKETLFSAILKSRGSETAIAFARKNKMDIDEDKLRNDYYDYLDSIKSAVEFEEFSVSDNKVTAESYTLQCITAILTLCSGLMGAAFVAADRKKGIRINSGSNIASVMLLFIISEAAAFILIGQIPDILRLILLNVGTWGICSVLPVFIKDEKLPWLFMPVCMVLVLIFDFVEISLIFPQLKIVNYLLLTHYYIYSNTIVFAVICAALGCCGIFANIVSERE